MLILITEYSLMSEVILKYLVTKNMQIMEKHCDPLIIKSKLTQLSWTSWQYLSKAEVHIPFDPEIPVLSNCPIKVVPHVGNDSNKMVYSLITSIHCKQSLKTTYITNELHK